VITLRVNIVCSRNLRNPTWKVFSKAGCIGASANLTVFAQPIYNARGVTPANPPRELSVVSCELSDKASSD